MSSLRNYFVITGAYWGFTITDGAIRMLVVLYFNQLGYAPLEIAFLFLFYEFFGVVTNLVGGWIGSRVGLNSTLFAGMALQVVALGMLAVDPSWLTVGYVMFAQALSGIAKDLNKMSAKASVKLMLPKGEESRLFKWVAVLTGSKNSLKGGGFFLGGLLLSVYGFQSALLILASGLFLLLVLTALMLPRDIGRSKVKAKFSQILSKTPAINWLSAARFFLFGARDIWFVVALPVFFVAELGWEHTTVGTFMALWIVGYGFVQASAPKLLRRSHHDRGPDSVTARFWVLLLLLVTAVLTAVIYLGLDPSWSLVIGLTLFGAVFAINSAVHSFLVLAYSDHDKVAMNVGFYYMANAGGRLIGTILSGGIYQLWGLNGCLFGSVLFLAAAWWFTNKLAASA